LRHVVWWKFTDDPEAFAASIIRVIMTLMMEAASASEMLVNFHQTT
jgi:hypothetical protein